MEPKKEMIKTNSRLPKFQTDWKIDKLISELAKHGVDICLRVDRTAPNEVSVHISTTTNSQNCQLMGYLLYDLYGIKGE